MQVIVWTRHGLQSIRGSVRPIRLRLEGRLRVERGGRGSGVPIGRASGPPPRRGKMKNRARSKSKMENDISGSPEAIHRHRHRRRRRHRSRARRRGGGVGHRSRFLFGTVRRSSFVFWPRSSLGFRSSLVFFLGGLGRRLLAVTVPLNEQQQQQQQQQH